jgi:hypothetical protein
LPEEGLARFQSASNPAQEDSMERQPMEAQMPPMEASQVASAAQLRLARQQGEVYGQALEAKREETGALPAKRVGDYEIAVWAEKAEGWYEMVTGPLGTGEPQLEWRPPKAQENSHIEVAVRDASDGRFVPELPMQVTVYAPGGSQVGSHRYSFVWHPWLFHYGRNWQVPGDGEYRIHVRIDPPGFPRRDRVNGRRYTEPVEADFTVAIEVGQKSSS